ncbi:MAG: helix-hairpin-helix domain-containing protein, partial [Thermodesulfobacteriota bacterium]
GPADLVRAVGRKDVARLSSVPGVGVKTAERIVLELKDKLAQLSALAGYAPAEAEAAPPAELTDQGADVVSALLNLGYSRVEAEKAVTAALAEPGADRLDLSGLIRQSLKRLRKA